MLGADGGLAVGFCGGLLEARRQQAAALDVARWLQDRAEVPRSGWHQLRHTAATLLAAEGADVATIGRMLGHRPGSVVTLRYLHTDDRRLKQAADAVAAALAGTETTPDQ